MMNVPHEQKFFDNDPPRAVMRAGFGEGLLLLGERDHRIVALSGDLVESTFVADFARKYPERYVECGVAEQSMASVASGLAAMGKIPFIASYAVFSPGRNWEQIRTTIAYNHMNVKIIGSHAGITVGPDGGSHQALEDIALMRVLPRMVVIAPCDKEETKKATLAAAAWDGPVYIRLSRDTTPVITTENTPFTIGEAQIIFAPDNGRRADVGIIATGSMTATALMAAQKLSGEGIAVKVLHVATVKPLDEKAISAIAEEAGAIVTAEEHQKIGGLGGAVAEYLSAARPTVQEFVGVDDRFGQSGTPAELLREYGCDTDALVRAAYRARDRKN